MTRAKQLWVLAGGNGAGKSTFYQHFLAANNLPLVNADILAGQLDPENSMAMSYKAAILVGKLRQHLLQAGISFCFETVFSHSSKIDFLASAKAHGYEIVLVYIHLLNDELNQARVAQRVMQGGHDVPAKKIISRIPRTMENIKKALPLVHVAKFYDNSSYERPFSPVAFLNHGILIKHQKGLPNWAEVMLAGYL